MEERERKERRSFPFLSRSRFLPFLFRHISTNNGPKWSNGWATSGAYLDMIDKKYKKGQERVCKDAKAWLERGKNAIGLGSRTGFNRGKNGFYTVKKTESCQIWEFGKGKKVPTASFHIFSAVSSPFRPLFHPFFTILAKNGTKGLPKNGETGKERKAFLPISFPFPFLPFLSWNISRRKYSSKPFIALMWWDSSSQVALCNGYHFHCTK